MSDSPSQSELGYYYTVGGVLSRAAQPKSWPLPEGFVRPSAGKQEKFAPYGHMTLLDIDDSRVIRMQGAGISGRKYEANLDLLVRDGRWPDGEPTFLGIGYAKQDEWEAFYEVWEWPEAQEWRAKLGLGPKDLHITLGVRGGDPHGVPKGRSTLLK